MAPKTDSMAEEIAAMEKRFMGKPSEQATQEQAESQETSTESTEEVITQQKTEDLGTKAKDVEPVQQTPNEDKDEEFWKKRFTNYKAHADATIAGLRNHNVSIQEELQEMREALETLRAKLAESTKEDPYKDLFTEEEKDLVGEETLAAMKKAQEAAFNSKLKPLQEQLEKERNERIKENNRRLEAEKQNIHRTFLQKLETLVPNYRDVDVSPKFKEWINQADEISGYPRLNIFKAAQRAGDVGRVAEFFKAFIKETTPPDRLAKKVTPVSKGTPPLKPKKETSGLTLKEINRFYDDVTRGKYRNRPKEQQEMERKIDNHLRKIGMDRR